MRFVLYGQADASALRCLKDPEMVGVLAAVAAGAADAGDTVSAQAAVGAATVGAAVSALAAGPLADAGLVAQREGRWVTGPNLVVPPEDFCQASAQQAERVARAYFERVRRALPRLTEAYQAGIATRLQGIPWAKAATLVTWGCVLDLGVGSQLVRLGHAEPAKGHWVWGLGDLIGRSFGVRMAYDPVARVGMASCWVDRGSRPLRLGRAEAEVLGNLRPDRPAAELGWGQRSREMVEAMLWLRFAGFVTGRGEDPRLAAPAFLPEEPLLAEVIPEIAGQLTSDLLEAYEALPEWSEVPPTLSLLVLQRQAMEGAAGHLAAEGLVSGEPSSWVWYGRQPWPQSVIPAGGDPDSADR